MYFNSYTGASRGIFSFKKFTDSPFLQILSNLLSTLNPRRLLSLVPAILCGCSGESAIETQIAVNNLSFSKVMIDWVSDDSTLDIFAFENDRLGRLDSYQRIDAFSGTSTAITSTGGDKTFFICMNSRRGIYNWSDIKSYSSLKAVYVDLEKEEPSVLTCCGELDGKAGEALTGISLRPLASEIVLRTIRCNFSGTPYSGETIKNVRVYLTNVNASCPILYEDDSRPSRFINCGMLNKADLLGFKNQDIIVRDMDSPINGDTSDLDIRLLCYPNRFIEDSPGSPQTRLVIEGQVESATYYWPITINPGIGIERGCRYVYDLLIRRKGCTDPDTAFDPISIEINMKVSPWIEKEEYTVGF